MDVRQCTEQGINYNQGVARFSGRVDLYEKYLRKFPLEPTFPELVAAMERGDTTEAFRQAHTLKGVAGNLSLNAFYNKLVTFVDCLRAPNVDFDKAKTLWPGVLADYQALATFLSVQ